jgi:hypothetical protein
VRDFLPRLQGGRMVFNSIPFGVPNIYTFLRAYLLLTLNSNFSRKVYENISSKHNGETEMQVNMVSADSHLPRHFG